MKHRVDLLMEYAELEKALLMFHKEDEIAGLIADKFEEVKEAKSVVPELIAAEIQVDVESVWVPIREPADGYVEGKYDLGSARPKKKIKHD